MKSLLTIVYFGILVSSAINVTQANVTSRETRWKFRNSSSTLQKRILPAPTGDSHQEIDEWMSQLYQGGTIRGSGLGPDLVDEASLRATPESRYDDFGREDFSVGLKGLRGCTSIVVLSKLGVYTSHFWEHAGFFKGSRIVEFDNINFEGRRLRRGRDDKPQWTMFRRYVLDALSGEFEVGGNFVPMSWHASKLAGTSFARFQYTRVYIVTPQMQGSLRYPERIEEIKQRLTEILPRLQNNNIEILPYFPVEGEETQRRLFESTARGKVLTSWSNNARGDGFSHDPGWVYWAEYEHRFKTWI